MAGTISRRQILSRSRDAGLDAMHKSFAPYEDYEEMWFSTEHLFKDHVGEVLRKWDQIDDEIWAKMIFMSRNRRIAKAYVRVPAVIVNGSDDGFDGFKVGLNGFDDPFRDAHTDQLMDYIDECRIGIADNGDLVLKRYSKKSSVFVRSFTLDLRQACVSNAVVKCNGVLEPAKPYVIFDMQRFETQISQELKQPFPDRRRLENQCIVVVGFVRNSPGRSLLELPIYVMFINIVALDLLKSKMTTAIYQSIADHRVTERSTRQQRDGGDKHGGGGGVHATHESSRGRHKSLKVPDFVSIFQSKGSKSSVDDYDEEEDIYGRISDGSSPKGGTSDDYISDYEARRFAQLRPPRNYYGAPTITTIRSRRNELDIAPNTPPRLPPRDKKKLSAQISTIKKSRDQTSRGVEIPRPDYGDEDDDDRAVEDVYGNYTTTTTRQPQQMDVKRKSWGPLKSDALRDARSRDDLYDTMSRSRSMVFHQKSQPTSYRERMIEDEDPYYSGLEARITSKKSHQLDRSSSKARGLNWMMRKVLSSAAINMLTTRRKPKTNKTPKSTGGSDSSDSDPYVSIAEVYEPIYGTTGPAHHHSHHLQHHPNPSSQHYSSSSHYGSSHHNQDSHLQPHWAATAGRRRPR